MKCKKAPRRTLSLCLVSSQDLLHLFLCQRVGGLRLFIAPAQGQPPSGQAQPAELIGSVGLTAHAGEAQAGMDTLTGGVGVCHKGVDIPVTHPVQNIQQGAVEVGPGVVEGEAVDQPPHVPIQVGVLVALPVIQGDEAAAAEAIQKFLTENV